VRTDDHIAGLLLKAQYQVEVRAEYADKETGIMAAILADYQTQRDAAQPSLF
jgi:hypothetical protein